MKIVRWNFRFSLLLATGVLGLNFMYSGSVRADEPLTPDEVIRVAALMREIDNCRLQLAAK